MDRHLRLLLLLVNYLAILVFSGFWVYTAYVVSIGGPWRVTELDRAGVFNEIALKKFDPLLAENLRYNVGWWVAENERNAGIRVCQIALGTSVLNILILHIAGFITHRQDRGKKRNSGMSIFPISQK